ncbi:MMPL family transporter [Gordonia sp. ABSL49_1]|uniref:MMPL family transporter n=1 Tax=Gordonia sp. ABSL49_1 TaxID=2920941 RepID=UPI001F117469|nr:MMPL family transporter [Gordonia sp. ABSL49_1]MCH5641020.1 MMPL family transporter [Gordonia sp. ABSL49_1]
MFGAIGTFVYRMRFAVIAVMIALMAGLGLYGLDLGKHLSQSGWFDPTSESVKGSQYADAALGRDHRSDIILLITPPEGTTVDNPEFGAKVEDFVNDLIAAHPDIVNRQDPGIIDPFLQQAIQPAIQERAFTDDKRHAFISIGVAGNDDTTVLNNYKTIEPFFDDIAERFGLQGTTFELAGLQPVAGSMADGMDEDIRRAEVIALPIVAIMLFFIFGGVVAACLPVLIGGLTIAGSLGIMKVLALTTELNIFAQSVVTLIGLGIAIDYGLFIVSRFREELAEGYSTKAAVRRTVMTAGQTVVFSATIIVAALACLLIMPQGFLKSVAYGAIASVSLAALLSITVLPAILSILGPRIDALSIRTLMGWTVIPVTRKIFGDKRADAIDSRFTGRIKTRADVENGFWGKLSGWVMQHPVATAVPTVLLLLVLIIPFGGIQFGGISEKYLPPDNANRLAQEHFDEYFPTERTEEIKLVIVYDPNSADYDYKLQSIADQANKIPGFTKQFSTSPNDSQSAQYPGSDAWIFQMAAGLEDRDTAAQAIKDLRAIDTQGLQMYVAGTPALTQDSIDALMSRLPLMAVLLVLVTGFLMFLAFGSIVLPIKAALMSALGLGSTLGILTWIFVDGHGAEIANFTPGPLFAAVLVLIIAIVFGLSTDYEIFLLSRMVEARQKGASTTEAVRVGTAHTGRIITAAAAILVVVTGAFGLSDIVMMKYIAYGMIAALILDATVIRMLLVPSVMKLLGDDCWWAPRWMRVMQQKIGLGETVLDDEPDEMRDSAAAARTMSAGTLAAEAPTSVMERPRVARPAAMGPPPGRGPSGRIRREQPEPATVATSRPVRGRAVGAPGPARPTTPAPTTAAPTTAAPMAAPTTSVPAAAPTRGGPAGPPPGNPPRRPTPYRRPTTGRNSGPDTGGWRLGDGGIRLGDPQPATSQAPQPPGPPAAPTQGPAPQGPAPRTAPAPTAGPAGPSPVGPGPVGAPPTSPPPDSPLRRRPTLNDTGKRPLAASLSPERTSPPPQQPRGTGDRMDRGLSPDAVPSAPTDSAQSRETADSDAPVSRRSRTDRHARSEDGGQISVQDLLRRSKSDS